ncbi:MAG: tetratricopeptide repeat protein [Spirochaetes bacterium]|nr:tetratricopeptide repeat protein [Spirochaetota bacterium]
MIKRLLVLLPVLTVLVVSCSNDKPTLRKSRADSSARDILEYGRALFNQEEYARAIEEYRYLISHFPDNKKECAWAQYELAYAYYYMDDYETAINEFKKVETFYPEQSGPIILSKNMITKIQIEMNQ